MKTTSKYAAPWLAAAAIGAAIALTPIASADTDPAVPYGTIHEPGHLRLPHLDRRRCGRAFLIHRRPRTGPVTQERWRAATGRAWHAVSRVGHANH